MHKRLTRLDDEYELAKLEVDVEDWILLKFPEREPLFAELNWLVLLDDQEVGPFVFPLVFLDSGKKSQ